MLPPTIKWRKKMKKITAYVILLHNSLILNLDKPESEDYKVIQITIPDNMQIMYSMANKNSAFI